RLRRDASRVQLQEDPLGRPARGQHLPQTGRHGDRPVNLRSAGGATGLVCLMGLGVSQTLAAGAWDFSGGVGVTGGRADNPGFAGFRNRAYNPSDPVCADTSDPNYSASVCTEKYLPRAAHSGNTTGSVRLSGSVTGTWDTTAFSLLY